MRTIQTTLRTGPDGVLTLQLRSGMADTDLDVVVIFQPVGTNGPKPVTDPKAWRQFVADTAGCIQDPTFDRDEQDDYEKRDAWG